MPMTALEPWPVVACFHLLPLPAPDSSPHREPWPCPSPHHAFPSLALALSTVTIHGPFPRLTYLPVVPIAFVSTPRIQDPMLLPRDARWRSRTRSRSSLRRRANEAGRRRHACGHGQGRPRSPSSLAVRVSHGSARMGFDTSLMVAPHVHAPSRPHHHASTPGGVAADGARGAAAIRGPVGPGPAAHRVHDRGRASPVRPPARPRRLLALGRARPRRRARERLRRPRAPLRRAASVRPSARTARTPGRCLTPIGLDKHTMQGTRRLLLRVCFGAGHGVWRTGRRHRGRPRPDHRARDGRDCDARPL